MKNMKKLLLFIFILTAYMCLFIFGADAYNGVQYNNTGIYYSVSNDEVTIVDTNEDIVTANIPAEIEGYPVTSIGKDAFSNCDNLSSIVLPDSVTSIGDGAFGGCSCLTSVIMGSSVTNIGNSAFSNCVSLTEMDIPDSVTNIGTYGFFNCKKLSSVTIGRGVKSIGNYAFRECTGLSKINWNAECVGDFNYDADLFLEAGIDENGIEVIFGDNVKVIPSYLFDNTYGSSNQKIISVKFGDNITSIGAFAFKNCSGLTSITIPNSVISIEDEAFESCTGLTSIKLGDGIIKIGDSAFGNCVSLIDISIPSSVKSIGGGAFYCCNHLKEVTIPDGVTTIGRYAFFGCTDLNKINWNAENVDNFNNEDEILFKAGTTGDGIDVVFGDNVKSIPAYAFYVTGPYRPKIKSVTIGNSVTSIGNYAFSNCTGLTSVTIPDSVTSIGKSAFSNCTGLTSITISDSIINIGNSAFSNCTGLMKINWNAENVSDFDSCRDVFYNAGTSGNGIDIVFGDNVKSIPAYAFYVFNSSYSPKIKSVTIGNSVTSIGKSAFENCTDLTGVHITDLAAWCKISFGSYNANPVCYAKKLYINGILATNITIPNSVTNIVDYAFYNCTSLTSLTVSDSVTSIGRSTFEGTAWYNAQPDGDIYIGNIYYKYKGTMPANTSIVIKEGTKGISSFAFSGRTGLTSVTIPDSVTSIGDYFFASCRGLETVKFTGKPPEFSNKTFYGYNKTVLYPYGISEWKSVIKSNYGGYFTWTCYSTGSLTDLQVNTLPTKTVYYQGENANYFGLSLNATWSDGFSTVITPDSKIYNISFFGFSTETPGIKTVTATLDGKSAQFKIGVHKTTTFTENQSKYPESAHNYADKLNQTKTYKCPDAIKLIVTFSDKTFVEKDGDYICVNGKKYTGDQLAGKTITVSGNTLTVQLVSDSYGNYYGYSIDKIEVTKIEHTDKTTTTKATTSADGKIVTACTICRKISKTVVIPKIASISLSAKSYTYDGKVKTPTVTVKNSKGTTLKNSTDYTVSYASGRKTPGQYAVKITLRGNYSGSKTLYFTILPGVTSKIATATNSSAIKIAWKAVPGATGYRIFQYDTKTKKYVTLKTTTGTSYTVTKLKSGTNYKFAVRAYTIVNGKVFWASGYKTVTATTNPGTPTLKVTAGTKKAALSWNKQTGATGYVVYMATSKNGKYSRIATLKGNSSVTYTKTGLTKGRTYYFKVAAYTVANGKTLYSSFSSVKAVKIK